MNSTVYRRSAAIGGQCGPSSSGYGRTQTAGNVAPTGNTLGTTVTSSIRQLHKSMSNDEFSCQDDMVHKISGQNSEKNLADEYDFVEPNCRK